MGKRKRYLPTSTDPDPTCPHTPVHGRERRWCSQWERATHTLSRTHSHTLARLHTDYRRPYIHTIWIVKVHRWGIIQLGGFCFFPTRPPCPRVCSALSCLLLSCPCPPLPPSPLLLVWPPASIRGPTLKHREDSSADSGRHLLSDPWSDLDW